MKIIDGNFPGTWFRTNPTKPMMIYQNSLVEDKVKQIFGIAFDGDGDRSIFCDENGKILTGDSSASFIM